MLIVDPRVGPYSSPDDIRAEIARVKKLADQEGRQQAIDMLKKWLEQSEKFWRENP